MADKSNVSSSVEDEQEQGPSTLPSFDPHWKQAEKEEEFEISTEEDTGLVGLLYRRIKVPKKFFEKCQDLMLQERQNQRATHHWPKSIFYLPMIQPQSKFAVCWYVFMLIVDLTYTAFGVPLIVGFCSQDFGDITTTCTKVDLTGGSIYFINLILGFQIGALATHHLKKLTVMKGGVVARAYIVHGRFIMDLAAVVPFLYEIAIVASPINGNNNQWASFVSLIRLVRLARLISLSKVLYFDVSSKSGKLHIWMENILGGVMGAYIILLVYAVCIIINLEACMVICSAYLNGLENSWLASVSWVDGVDGPKALQWYLAVYITILTNVGLGSWTITPGNFSDMVIFNIDMFVGMIIFGIMVAASIYFATNVSTRTRALYKLQLKLQRVNRFSDAHKLPADLSRRLEKFYRTEWVQQQQEAQEVGQGAVGSVSKLPTDLRGTVARHTLVPLMSVAPWFGSSSQDTLTLLGSKMTAKYVDAGTELCLEGDEPDCLWLLEQGEVQVLNLRGNLHRTLTAPAVFGDAAMMVDEIPSCRDRLFGYSTSTYCRLWKLTLRDIQAAMRVCPGIRVSYLVYVQMTLLQILTGYPTDEHWNEIVAKIMVIFGGTETARQDDVVKEMRQVSRHDGSLQLLLDALLELSTLSRVEVEDVAAALAVPAEATEALISGDAEEGSVEEGSGLPLSKEEDAAVDTDGEEAGQADKLRPSLSQLLHALSIRKAEAEEISDGAMADHLNRQREMGPLGRTSAPLRPPPIGNADQNLTAQSIGFSEASDPINRGAEGRSPSRRIRASMGDLPAGSRHLQQRTSWRLLSPLETVTEITPSQKRQ